MIQRCLLEAGLSRGDLSEAEWRVLRQLLPLEPGKRGAGRPPTNNREVINGILWRLRAGAPWRDLPERYGNWNSVFRRFRRWSASGVWEAVSTGLADMMGDAAHHSIDSTTVRAHVSAAGAKKGAVDRLLAARGAGGPVSFTASPTPGDARSRST